MALNIKNAEVERLAEEVASLTGESKTEAVRRALAERRERLALQVSDDRGTRLRAFLRDELWPTVPADVLGTRTTREEIEAILGFGESGA
jgi:antitoxin VapB